MVVTDAQINFNAPASLRKWPSIKNQRRTDTAYPRPYRCSMTPSTRVCDSYVQAGFAPSFIRNSHRPPAAIGRRRLNRRTHSRTCPAAGIPVSVTLANVCFDAHNGPTQDIVPSPKCADSGGHPAKIMPAPSAARMAPSQADNGGGSPLIIHIIGSITTGAIELRTATSPAS
jgi:hypothetical protein